jgi:hypothetical protein
MGILFKPVASSQQGVFGINISSGSGVLIYEASFYEQGASGELFHQLEAKIRKNAEFAA